MCDCIELTNKALAEKGTNTEIVSTLPLFGDIARVLISVAKIDEKKRGKPINLLPSYCPFCGEKYPAPQE